MDINNPSGLTEEELQRGRDTEIQRYTGDPDDPSTPNTTTVQEKIAAKAEEEAKEKEEKETKKSQPFASGRDSAGTEMDHKVMEVAGPVTLSALGLPFIDLGMDLVGHLGGQSIDDAWDEKTKFSSPLAQATRDITGVIVPTIVGSMFLGPVGGSAAAKATGGSAIARGLGKVFTTAAVDVAVVGVSDYSERDEGVASALDRFLDRMGNPLGMNIPDAVKVMDGDSAPVRRQKLMLESGIFSLVGDALGYTLQRGRGPVEWMIPKDEVAKNYKITAALENPDPYSVKATHEIDQNILEARQEKLAKGITKEESKVLDDAIEQMQIEKDIIIEEVSTKGISSKTDDPLESYVQRNDASRDFQTDEIGSRKLMADPQYTKFDPDIQSELADPSQTVRFSSPPAAVARNAADIAMMEKMPQKGVPTPVVTDPMLQDGLGVGGGSREVIASIAEEKSQAGIYDAGVGAMRATYKEIEDSGWNTLTQILEAEDVEEIKSLFLTKRDLRDLGGGVGIKVIGEPTAMEVGPALQALTSLYLSGDIAKTSARVMKTTGLEIDAIAEAMYKFKGAVDPDRATQIIMDKMVFLFEEYGLNKSLAGWSLANKRWWPPKKKSGKQIYEEITALVAKNRDNAVNMHTRMKALMEKNPEAAHTLAMAYDMTKGEIDTLDKMFKWARGQMNPGSLIFNPGGDLNLFAKGLKQIRYNNVLSGLSAMTATVGNGVSLILKPIEYMSGALGMALASGDGNMIRRGLYAFNSFDAQGPALKDAYDMFIRASKNPDEVMARIRKDYQFTDDAKWEVFDRMEDLALKEGKTGDAYMIRWMRWNRDMGKNPVMRWGTNAMLAIDTYSNTLLATANSKFRAFDEVLTAGAPVNRVTLDTAAQKHMRNVFDENGLINDTWLKHTSGELALNAETGIAETITGITNRLPFLTPFFMFPNTGVNWVRKSLTYLPVANLVDGRTRKLLTAGNNQEKIFEALLAHGIEASKEPQAMMIYQNLKAENLGRLAMGTGLTLGLAQYALAGNIRGNIPPGKQDQRFWRQNNIQPKMIKVMGKWISYDGILPLDPALALIGDAAYHARDIGSKSIQDKFDQLAWTFAQSFTGATPISGLEPLVQLVGGDRGAALQRFIANETRSMVPMSGAMSVLANSVSTAQRDIYNDWRTYLMNRLPGVNTLLPEQIDVWTGNPIREIDNPMLRIMNALSPIKVSEGPEEWRQWLLNSGFNGTHMLRKDSTGAYELSPEEREIIMKYVGEQELWKEVETMSTDDKYNLFLDELREGRNQEFNSQMRGEITKNQFLPEQVGPVYERLNKLVKQAQERAERKALENGDIPRDSIYGALLSRKYLKYGNVQRALVEQKLIPKSQ